MQTASADRHDTLDGADPAAAISTVGLRKVYTRGRSAVVALDGLDLSVSRGEFFGLLGTNGAGKSTTLGMLTTLVTPTAGQAWVAGHEVGRDPVGVKSRIGVVSQANTMDRQLSVLDNLAFRGRYFGMRSGSARRRAMTLLEQFDLADKSGAKVHELSGGQVRRAMIGRALMHLPEVLFLDEPTAGVDPQAREDLWRVIGSLHDDGQTVVLTTHNLDEAETLCQRVAVIDHGRLLACDTPAALKATSAAMTTITVEFDAAAHTVGSALSRSLSGSHEIAVEGPAVRIRTPLPDGVLVHVLREGRAAGLAVRDVTTTPPSLQTAFLSMTGRDFTP